MSSFNNYTYLGKEELKRRGYDLENAPLPYIDPSEDVDRMVQGYKDQRSCVNALRVRVQHLNRDPWKGCVGGYYVNLAPCTLSQNSVLASNAVGGARGTPLYECYLGSCFTRNMEVTSPCIHVASRVNYAVLNGLVKNLPLMEAKTAELLAWYFRPRTARCADMFEKMSQEAA